MSATAEMSHRRGGARRCGGATVLGLGLALVVAATRPAAAAGAEVTLQLKWHHQSQFAGFYAADRLGFYRAAGVTVRLEEFRVPPAAAADDTVAGRVVAGRAAFGIDSAENVIRVRDQGHPVRAVAAIYHRTPIVIMVLRASGIRTPRGIAGHTARVPSAHLLTFSAVMKMVGVDIGSVRIIDSDDFALFRSGAVPVWTTYITWDGYRAETEQLDVAVFYPEDYGVPFYGDVLFTTDPLIRTAPELVRAVVAASLRGWRHALDHPEQAISWPTLYSDRARDVAFQRNLLLTSLPLIDPGTAPIGWMARSHWADMIEMLRDHGLIGPTLAADDVFTTAFLTEDRLPPSQTPR